MVKIMLPVNRDITIKENNFYYSTSFKLDDAPTTAGNIKTFSICEDSTLAVSNHLDAIVPTGVFDTHSFMQIAALSVLFLLAFVVILKRRAHNKQPKA